MQVAVCDDNKLFLAGFEKQLRDIPFVDAIFPFSDYNAFLFSIDEGKQFDAVLLDIDWDQHRNGIDIAEELYKLSPSSKIIYVTGHHEQYSQRIFLHKTNLSGFLTKPVDTELLRANLQKVADALPFEEEPMLVLRQRGAPVSIPVRTIFYVESRGHTVEVHTAEETVVTYERLEAVSQMLATGFYQCHKSYIVNMGQIRRFEPSGVLLKNGEQIPVSRARYQDTRKAYFRYMGQSF